MSVICAVVPFTGSEELVAMTERMLQRLALAGVDHIVAVNNAASRHLSHGLADSLVELVCEKNLGFGRAVNAGIRATMNFDPLPTHILVANNDLEIDDLGFLEFLKDEIEGNYVLTPTTDVTASPDARATWSKDVAPTYSAQVSAFCWLVPANVIDRMMRRYGFELFDPAFFAYGEDDLTCAILRKQFGKRPFKVVHRAWVRHLKGRTAKEVGVRPGDPKNLQLLRERKRALGVK